MTTEQQSKLREMWLDKGVDLTPESAEKMVLHLAEIGKILDRRLAVSFPSGTDPDVDLMMIVDPHTYEMKGLKVRAFDALKKNEPLFPEAE